MNLWVEGHPGKEPFTGSEGGWLLHGGTHTAVVLDVYS